MQPSPPNFHFPETNSFRRFSSKPPENLWKLSIYGKFPHHEFRWKSLHLTQCNYDKEETNFEQNNLARHNCFL